MTLRSSKLRMILLRKKLKPKTDLKIWFTNVKPLLRKRLLRVRFQRVTENWLLIKLRKLKNGWIAIMMLMLRSMRLRKKNWRKSLIQLWPNFTNKVECLEECLEVCLEECLEVSLEECLEV